jgi:hypothetical protein
MSPKRWQFAVGVLLIVLMLAASAGPQVARAQTTIFDQVGAIGTGAISSNLPNFTGGARSLLAADDFTVVTASNTVYWLIQSITVYGQNNSGSPTINGFNIYVYRDSGGLPGALYSSQFVASFSGGAPTYVIPINILLPGGPSGQKYWLSVQASVTSTGIASWSWQSSSAGGGSSESAWYDVFGNQNGGLCGPAQGWGPRVSVCSVGSQNNMAFQLVGLNNLNLPTNLYLPMIRR